MDYATAVDRLQTPDSWCEGAQALGEIGDPKALVPLLQAYETPGDFRRGCLLDAMEMLEPVAGALELANDDDGEIRRMGIHLMELFPDERYLQILEQIIDREGGSIRRQALRSLTTQVQTPAWESILIRLLQSEHHNVRTMAIDNLARRRSDAAHQALRDHLAHESDPDLKARIEQALG